MKRLFLTLCLLWATAAYGQQAPIVLTEGNRPTYCYGISTFVPTGVVGPFFYLTGSASKTVRVVSSEISGLATAASVVDGFWAKRTAAYTGGTTSNGTPSQMDTAADSAATAVPKLVTATTTAGAGQVARAFKFMYGTTATVPAPIKHTYGRDNERALVLRGVNEAFELNLGTAPAGVSIALDVCWVEE
jgi:hypothetical protein